MEKKTAQEMLDRVILMEEQIGVLKAALQKELGLQVDKSAESYPFPRFANETTQSLLERFGELPPSFRMNSEELGHGQQALLSMLQTAAQQVGYPQVVASIKSYLRSAHIRTIQDLAWALPRVKIRGINTAEGQKNQIRYPICQKAVTLWEDQRAPLSN